jgi:hypothetical protein
MSTLLRKKEPKSIARFDHCDVQTIIVQAYGHRHVLASDLLGDERQGLGVRLVTSKVGHGHTEEFRQRIDKASLFEDAHLDKQLAEAAA